MATSAEPHDINSTESTVAISSHTGIPRYNRRLSDKILAAFNHAYAVGEIEMASRLREILARLDKDQAEGEGQRRDGAIALCQADLWIEFVEVRNDYRIKCDKPDLDAGIVQTSLDAMKGVYQRWSAT